MMTAATPETAISAFGQSVQSSGTGGCAHRRSPTRTATGTASRAAMVTKPITPTSTAVANTAVAAAVTTATGAAPGIRAGPVRARNASTGLEQPFSSGAEFP